MIARFALNGYEDCYMEPLEDGEYVLYSDHHREIEIMQSSVDYWRNESKLLVQRMEKFRS